MYTDSVDIAIKLLPVIINRLSIAPRRRNVERGIRKTLIRNVAGSLGHGPVRL